MSLEREGVLGATHYLLRVQFLHDSSRLMAYWTDVLHDSHTLARLFCSRANVAATISIEKQVVRDRAGSHYPSCSMYGGELGL